MYLPIVSHVVPLGHVVPYVAAVASAAAIAAPNCIVASTNELNLTLVFKKMLLQSIAAHVHIVRHITKIFLYPITTRQFLRTVTSFLKFI